MNKRKNKKKVSIIIPTFNAENLLAESLTSALNQSYKNIEVIIIDDGSTDNTYKKIKDLIKANTNIVYIKQKNTGLSGARNRGMDIATGDYFFFLDSDDLILKDGIKKLVHEIEKNKADSVVCNWINFGEGRRPELQKPGNMFPEDVIASLMKKPMVCSAILIRKTSLRFNKTLKTSELFDFFFRYFLLSNKIVYLDRVIVKIRQHNSPNRLTNKVNHYDPAINLPIYTNIKKKYIESKKLTKIRQAVLEEKILSRIYAAASSNCIEWTGFVNYVTRSTLPSFYWFKKTGLSGFCWVFGVALGVRIFTALNKLIGRGVA